MEEMKRKSKRLRKRRKDGEKVDVCRRRGRDEGEVKDIKKKWKKWKR
jgi:hypothetical protein